ncbi:hypothetical protein [Azospirillum sp. B4]|uniref:hypothetical protein n=1 Tax=Azospirillum sp. B4 TaxID=95605 RepID=UPI0005C8107E|nr:hypothetical protein [Azospirillum sp. B4]
MHFPAWANALLMHFPAWANALMNILIIIGATRTAVHVLQDGITRLDRVILLLLVLSYILERASQLLGSAAAYLRSLSP